MKALFVGDISPTVCTNDLFAKQDVQTLFTDVLPIFEKRDLIFCNLECAITESENAIQKIGPNLKSCFGTEKVLKMLGVTVAGLSNNHIFDFGKEGVHDTVRALSEVGVDYTGFGKNYADARKNYTFTKDGESVCVIAVCEHEYSYALEDRMGSRPFDEFETMDDIRAAKQDHDRVIVIYHGGKEHCLYPSPRLLRACRAMARNGADMVLCQHSHCIGTYEFYEGCHILYGQGNFHFVKDMDKLGWDSGFAVFYDTKNHEIEFIPVCQKEDVTGIRLMTGEEKEILMQEFARRNGEIQSGAWCEGWRAFCRSVAPQYLRKVERACNADSTERQNAGFAHYLDCEAHTDVWRELFPTYNLTNEK